MMEFLAFVYKQPGGSCSLGRRKDGSVPYYQSQEKPYCHQVFSKSIIQLRLLNVAKLGFKGHSNYARKKATKGSSSNKDDA